MGVWLPINKEIFQGVPSFMEVLVAQSLGILDHFSMEKVEHPMHIILQEIINKTSPWGYFDMAA